MMQGNQPIYILKEGTEREKETAQENNILAGRAIAEAVKTTLGPKGMDKMLVNSMGDIIITNDGATILKEIDVEHPAAKMVIEVSESQDQECGDGTTTVVVLTGELLKQAQDLIDKKIHPTIINKGYSIASKEAIKKLNEIAVDVNGKGTRDILYNIAMTSMASKGASSDKEHLANLIVDALLQIKNEDGKVDLDDIHLVKVDGASINNTELVNGMIISKERSDESMPSEIKGAKVLLLNYELDTKKTSVESKINISSPDQLQKYLDQEEGMLKDMVDKVYKSGANVVFCQKGIDEVVLGMLARKGIYAIRRVQKNDMKKLSKALNTKIVSNLEDILSTKLGKAEKVMEDNINKVKITRIKGCINPKAVTILLRGSTQQVLEELNRALHDALSVVKVAIEDGKIIPGGGAYNIELAKHLRQFAPTIGGREQMAIESYADALEVIPKVLAENAGMDAIDVLIDMKQIHSGKRGLYWGLNVNTSDIENMLDSHIIEPLRLLSHEIETSTEAATMILRIDDVIASKQMEMPPQSGPSPGMPPNPYM